MVEVAEMKFGVPCNTRVWFSSRAASELGRMRKKGDPNGAFWKKFRQCAMDGFGLYESVGIVKHEWSQVYRFGIKSSLFRLIGFYADNGKGEFIVMDAFDKLGQSLTAPQRARIEEVARVKREADWKKENDEYPRLSQ